MNKELKKAIVSWLLDNENAWQRTNACTDHFRAYIYDDTGNYLIGGEVVADFIRKAEALLFEN